MRSVRTLPVLALAALAACGGDDGTTPPPIDAAAPPAWQPGLPAAATMGARRGLTPVRGIIHLHSPFSHDACDGNPRPGPGGEIDETCLAHLRAALCTLHIGYAALTDHDASMADEDFATLFSARGSDELIMGANGPIASRVHCADGHAVLLTVGSENPMMPIMLDRHVPGTVAERHDVYNADTPAAVAAFHDAGALVWIPHTEQRTTAALIPLAPDGIEIYNLHANLDPNIRRDHLGLDPNAAIQAVIAFAEQSPEGPEPDLALLSFLEPSTPALTRWDELLAAGLRVTGSAGTDAHENTLPIMLRDGERGDSYRRMMRWFANVALTTQPDDPVAIEAALAAGRMFVAFELLGTPVGFDLVATAGATTFEMGDEVRADAGATLTLTVPTIADLAATLPAPTIAARVVRIDSAGVAEVASGAGPTLTVALDRPGAYRAEVRMVPRHLGPYLGLLGPAYSERELPWIYANPIYVTAP
ncbi:MAG: hypothetical protein IPL61_16160 [Myxococcales bacterium]|nr:hypothetical protein [Myxococcales bacterium]